MDYSLSNALIELVQQATRTLRSLQQYLDRNR